jgi:hypothetical protein
VASEDSNSFSNNIMKIISRMKVVALLGLALTASVPVEAQSHKSIPLDAGGWFSGFAVNKPTGRLYGYGDVFGGWRSDNNGATWKFLNNTIIGRVDSNSGNVSIDHFLQGIAVGSDPNKVAFRTPGRLYTSTNGGDDWTASMTDLTDSGLVRSSTPIVYRPGNDQEIWVAGNRTAGGKLWRSINGGSQWTRMDTGVLADKNIVTLNCHPDYPNQMWVGADGGLYVSINTNGTWSSWTQVWGAGMTVSGVSGSRNGLPVRVKSISRHSSTGSIFDGIGWLVTDMGGFRVIATNWNDPATYSVQGPNVSSYGGFGPDSGSVLKDSRGQGGEVFISTRQYPMDQKISTDAGATWVSYPMMFSMPPQPIWGDPSTSGTRLDATDQIVQDPFNSSRWFATNGKSPVISVDAGRNWTYVPNNSGVASVVTWKVNFAAENRNVALIPGADKGAFVVTDQGTSGTATYSSNSSFNVLMTAHEVMSSKDGQILVAAGVDQAPNKTRIVKSINGGRSWINLDLSASGLPLSSEGVVRSVMNPNDPQDFLVLLGTGGTNSNPGLWRTTNGGASFTQVLSGLPDTGSRNHTGSSYMEADSKQPNRRYLVVRTNLYRSTDYGQNWSAPVQPLGNAWVQAFSADDQVAGKLWAGNRYGLKKSTTYGDTWTSVTGFTWCYAVDAVAGRVAVWGTRTGDTWPKIYYSSNDGADWIEASGVGHRYAWTRELAVDPWEPGKIWVSGISANVISGLPSTGPATAPVLSAPSASPTTLASGESTALGLDVTDGNGADDLRYVHLMLAPQGSAVTPWATGGGLWMHFNAVERKLYQWTGSDWGNGIAMGSSGTLTTPQGTLTLASNWATYISNGFRFNITFTPNTSFVGTFTLRALAQDTQPVNNWDLNSVKTGSTVTITAAPSSPSSKTAPAPSGGDS